jgi:hypothetical protein
VNAVALVSSPQMCTDSLNQSDITGFQDSRPATFNYQPKFFGICSIVFLIPRG